MKTETTQSKFFIWIFYLLSVGMLTAGGIYIEKIILTSSSTADIIKALLFCVLGAGISACGFFGSRRGSEERDT